MLQQEEKNDWNISEAEEEEFADVMQSDPLAFADEILGVKLWQKQREIIKSTWKYKITLVKASYNVGKTFVGGVITLAWLVPNVNSKVLTTAPTAKQVEDLLWGEVHNLIDNAKYPLFGQEVNVNLSEIVVDGKKWYATGISVQVGKEEQSAVRISGYHAPVALVLIDEASGVHPAIWKALNGFMSSTMSRMLALTNPRTNMCEFKALCDSAKGNKNINVITISAFDHPNIITGKDIIPGSVSIDWVEEMILKHCEPVKRHNAEDYTFEWKDVIYRPDDEALWELLGEFPRVSDELFFASLEPKIHHMPAENMPTEAVVIPGFMDYGNWNVCYHAKMDNKHIIYVDNEFVIPDTGIELKERADLFRNWCFYNGYKDWTVIGDTDMFNEPARAYGGGRPVWETFDRVCNLEAPLHPPPEGVRQVNGSGVEMMKGLNITFVRAQKSKVEGYTYRKYCNRQVKDRLNWRKDGNELWLLMPTIYIDKDKCPYLYATVLGKSQSGIGQKLIGVPEDCPGLVKSPLYPEDFDQAIGIDHAIDAFKGMVAAAPLKAPASQMDLQQQNEEIREMLRKQFEGGL